MVMFVAEKLATSARVVSRKSWSLVLSRPAPPRTREMEEISVAAGAWMPEAMDLPLEASVLLTKTEAVACVPAVAERSTASGRTVSMTSVPAGLVTAPEELKELPAASVRVAVPALKAVTVRSLLLVSLLPTVYWKVRAVDPLPPVAPV